MLRGHKETPKPSRKKGDGLPRHLEASVEVCVLVFGKEVFAEDSPRRLVRGPQNTGKDSNGKKKGRGYSNVKTNSPKEKLTKGPDKKKGGQDFFSRPLIEH